NARSFAPSRTWQLTHPLPTNRRRPRSAGSKTGGFSPGTIARMGSIVVLLFPQPLLTVIVQSPGDGTVIVPRYMPSALNAHAEPVTVRQPDFASILGLRSLRRV